MPNHCNNSLYVVGDPYELSLFLAEAQRVKRDDGSHSVFQSLMPCPKELHSVPADGSKRPELVEKYGHSDWYDWCNANWGTKWGDYNTHFLGSGDDYAAWAFTTAWGPGLEFVERMAVRYPKLAFVNSYDEEGMGFMGVSVFADGTLLSEGEGDFVSLENPDDYEDEEKMEAKYEQDTRNFREMLESATSELSEEKLAAFKNARKKINMEGND